ncbi:hypothetical protein EAE99_010779 [Botrytis elliptica]|nr:hypothetical protein EAE99_010779 [Botrytis elliptica]
MDDDIDDIDDGMDDEKKYDVHGMDQLLSPKNLVLWVGGWAVGLLGNGNGWMPDAINERDGWMGSGRMEEFYNM